MKHKLGENESIQLKLPFAGAYVCGIFHIFLQVCVASYPMVPCSALAGGMEDLEQKIAGSRRPGQQH